MIYLYKCEKCNITFELAKPISESSNETRCGVCHSIVIRVYTAPSIKTGDGVK